VHSLEQKRNKYIWGKGINLFKILESDFAVRLAGFIGEEALRNKTRKKLVKPVCLANLLSKCKRIYFLGN